MLGAFGLGGAAALAGCTTTTTANELSIEPANAPVQQAADTSLGAAETVTADRVAADPRDIPAPITRKKPAVVEALLETEEVVAEVEPGVTFRYMTFNGQIPGPLVRTRVGDTVDLTIRNPASNTMVHNVDFHAARGPGGGAEATTVAPGEEKHLRFKVTYPGAFVYHCAVGNVDYHISAGMFGLILVEPEEGLPPVDHEFYLGQHELYTNGATGQKGHHEFDFEKMAAEDPTYVLMNGEKFALGPQGYDELVVKTTDSVRVFFAVGGPNLQSHFHPIGSVWETVYRDGALASDPDRFVQTVPVAPGSSAVTTADFRVPGNYKLVDHALSRVVRKGCLAVLRSEGPENPTLFDPQ